MSEGPVFVARSPLTELALSNLRVALVALGAFVAGRAWLSEQKVAQYLPLAMIVLPWAWGQWSRFELWLKAKTAAAAAPDEIARVR